MSEQTNETTPEEMSDDEFYRLQQMYRERNDYRKPRTNIRLSLNTANEFRQTLVNQSNFMDRDLKNFIIHNSIPNNTVISQKINNNNDSNNNNSNENKSNDDNEVKLPEQSKLSIAASKSHSKKKRKSILKKRTVSKGLVNFLKPASTDRAKDVNSFLNASDLNELKSKKDSNNNSHKKNKKMDNIESDSSINGETNLDNIEDLLQPKKIIKKKQIIKVPKKLLHDPYKGNMIQAVKELLPPLEKAAIELANLLRDSLSRFKKTNACDKIYDKWLSLQKKDIILNEM